MGLLAAIGIAIIRDFLGHEDVKTTEIYARATEAECTRESGGRYAAFEDPVLAAEQVLARLATFAVGSRRPRTPFVSCGPPHPAQTFMSSSYARKPLLSASLNRDCT